MSEVHNGEPDIIEEDTVATLIVNGTPTVDHPKVNNAPESPIPQPQPQLPTSRDISDKLIHDKIQSLNIENHELKAENGEYRARMGQLEKACAELKTRADRASAGVESAKRELSSMVIKYATSEKEVINLKKHYAESDRKCKELMKERDAIQAKIQELTKEKKQLFTNVERSVLEAATLRHENEILKNRLSQADVRTEQLQLQIADLNRQLTTAREKLDRIESGFGALNNVIIQRDAQFKLEDEEDEVGIESEPTETEEEEEETTGDHETNWTDQYLQCLEHNKRLTAELDALITERGELKSTIQQLEAKLAEAEERVRDYGRRGELIESLKAELLSKQAAIDSLKDKFDRINTINRDLVTDVDSSKNKEGELLEYTERLTAKLVSLQSEHNILAERLKCTEEQCEHFRTEHSRITAEDGRLQTEFGDYRREKETQLAQLNAQLEERSTENVELRRRIDELENDIKIVKRKHIANLRELNKEIQSLKKQQQQQQQQQTELVNREHQKLASQTSQSVTEASSTLSSRTNSFNSLTEINQNGQSDSGSSQSSAPVYVRKSENTISQQQAQQTDNSTSSSSSSELITSLNDIDRNTLIERILRLQRALVKRTEKIDFLEEHNGQLMEEVKKKGRLLQYYILKEEAGALATESMDKNKAYLSRRGGGIMSSLYNSTSIDETVTLERSLEINSKLHAVLEDTLLKNMTLKENLNTLASEIDRLTKTKK